MLWGALAFGVEADTDTDVDTDTDTDADVDTDTDADADSDTGTAVDNDTAQPCPECITAADLAGEKGGNPCADGCQTGAGGALPAFALVMAVAWGTRRQTALSSTRR